MPVACRASCPLMFCWVAWLLCATALARAEVPVAVESVACAGKPVCKPDDVLKLKFKAALKSDDPVAVTLSFKGESLQPIEVRQAPRGADKSEVEIDLAEVLDEQPRRGKLFEAWTRQRDLRVAFEVSVGAGTPTHPLKLDLAPLYKSGQLGLRVENARCGNEPAETCQLLDTLSADLVNLDAWALATDREADKGKLQMTLDGRVLEGAAVRLLPPDAASAPATPLRFDLKRDRGNDKNLVAWNTAIEQLRSASAESLALGLAVDGKPLARVGSVSFANKSATGWTYALCLGGLAVVVLVLAWRNGWLRDNPPIPPLAGLMPYSLGKSQMSFWTVVVTASWLYFGATTGDWNTWSGTALVLMGINAATALGAQAINTYTDVQIALAKAWSEAHALESQLRARLATLEDSIPSNAAAKAMRDQDIAKTVAEIALQGKSKADNEAALLARLPLSKGYWRDITSDDGVNTGLHRLQTIVFTLGFAWLFCRHGYLQLTMPVFSDLQLALLGISGTAYVGFKTQAAK